MTGFETAITLFEDIFFSTTFAGQLWIMYIIILVATLLIITRNWQDWGELLLPIMVGWTYFGMPVPISFLIIGSILFVVSILSLKTITGTLSVMGEKIRGIRTIPKLKTPIEFQSAMHKLKVEKDYEKAELEKAVREATKEERSVIASMTPGATRAGYSAKMKRMAERITGVRGEEFDTTQESHGTMKEIEKREAYLKQLRKKLKKQQNRIKVLNTRPRYIDES